MKIKKSNAEVIHNQVITTLDSQTNIAPHTLMELSVKQWKRLQNNCIKLSSITIDKSIKRHPIVSYDTIEYGSNEKANLIKRKEMNGTGKRIF